VRVTLSFLETTRRKEGESGVSHFEKREDALTTAIKEETDSGVKVVTPSRQNDWLSIEERTDAGQP